MPDLRLLRLAGLVDGGEVDGIQEEGRARRLLAAVQHGSHGVGDRLAGAGAAVDDPRPGLAPGTRVGTVRWTRTPTLLISGRLADL